MIIIFYLMYVGFTNIAWSWLWFLIAIWMQVAGIEIRAKIQDTEKEEGGPPYDWHGGGYA